MAAKLTDEQKQKIIADYARSGSYRATARENNVSDRTVRRLCGAGMAVTETTDEGLTEVVPDDGEDIQSFLQSKRSIISEIINKGLAALNDEDKLRQATAAQITSTMGTLIDKFTVPDGAGIGDGRNFELPARVIGRAFADINREIVPNKSYVFCGGRGSLKSSFISEKILELLINNPQMHACIVRKVYATVKDSVYAQMLWAIAELGLEEEFSCKTSPYEIVYKPTGQTIYFRGCDDPMKIKGIKPRFGYVGILWKEEADQLGGPNEERSVNQSVLRGGPESYDFSSYNPPPSRRCWVNQRDREPDENRVLHRSTYLDVPPEWLGQKFLEDAEQLRKLNPAAYANEYMGEATGDGGNVFENLELRAIPDGELARFDRIYNGLDWGYWPDPWAFNRMHYDAARMTLYIFAEATRLKAGNRETAALLRGEFGLTESDLITADSAEMKSVRDYQELGLWCKGAVKGPNSVAYSVKWLQSRVKIVIDPVRCPDTAREFSEYEYEKDRDGNIISAFPDANNHHIDAVRYAMEAVWKKRGQ